MILPVRIARKLTRYISYALFCAFTLVDVLYTGKNVAVQYGTVLRAEHVMHKANDNLLLARHAMRSMINDEAAAGKPLDALAEDAHRTKQAYALAEHENDLRVMGWAALAVGWLFLLSVYFEEVGWGTTVISLLVVSLGILFIRAFVSLYGAFIWHWLNEPVAGHSHGVWLLGAATVSLSAAAIYHDFFRSTPVVTAE